MNKSFLAFFFKRRLHEAESRHRVTREQDVADAVATEPLAWPQRPGEG